MTQLFRRRELEFLLYDLAQTEELFANERFAHLDRESADAILDTAIRIAQDKFVTHVEKLDQQEPTWDGESVSIIDEVKVALDAFAESGLIAGPVAFEDGGMQLPLTLAQAYMSVFYATNADTAAYALLTNAAANLIIAHGSKAQRATWVPPMLEGRFYGTMCLSEPQAGSSLGDITTLATPNPDGDYNIVGSKMWISGGEHELSENIVHLVLARLPDAPAGVKGISLFIVPRYRAAADGTYTCANDVGLAGVNHKMGYRGTVNCALNFGENGECVGSLVGEAHRGLRYMFHMMNEARIGVGLCAASLGHAGFLYSLDYAKERTQGRSILDRDPAAAPVPIIEHTDVKRMLLAQKAYSEGALALTFKAARLVDDIAIATSQEDREDHTLFLDFLTPIVKAWTSEYCTQANSHAIQILGGYGYSREYPVERIYRTNRLNAIHEGANGIQSLDLLGRKVIMKEGAAVRMLMSKVAATCTGAADLGLGELADTLMEASQAWASTTMTVCGAAMQGRVDVFLANSWEYLEATGHLVIAWIWLEQAVVATQALADGGDDFYRGKIAAAKYFFAHELPKNAPRLALLCALDTTCLVVDPATF